MAGNDEAAERGKLVLRPTTQSVHYCRGPSIQHPRAVGGRKERNLEETGASVAPRKHHKPKPNTTVAAHSEVPQGVRRKMRLPLRLICLLCMCFGSFIQGDLDLAAYPLRGEENRSF